MYSAFFFIKREPKCEREADFDPEAIFGEVFFRERNFSLEYRTIRPSAGFETRRKNVLRGAGYAWTPDL